MQTTPFQRPPNCSLPEATRQATVLVALCRLDDGLNPEMFASAVVALLAAYPEAVAKAVANPVSGLPATLKWPLRIADVKEACGREMEPLYRQLDRDRRYAQTHNLLTDGGTSPEARDRAFERWEREIKPELKARSNGDGQPKRELTIGQLCAWANVSREAFDALPENRRGGMPVEKTLPLESLPGPLPQLSDTAKAIFEKGK